jgi:hypothetical protein
MKHWTQEEIELIKENAKNGIQYKETAKQIGRTAKAVTLKMQKLGYVFEDFYTKPTLYCQNCEKELTTGQYKYCSQSCSATQNNKKYPKRKKEKVGLDNCVNCNKSLTNCSGLKYCCQSCQHEFQNKENLKSWLNGNDKGYTGETKQLKGYIRNFLLKEAEHKCSKCGWCEIHPITNKTPLEINHIDGDACNCKPENLEVLCPSCHSLTYNFRALNKDSKRKRKR